MTDQTTQDGVTMALLERFETYTLPRAVDIKAKVDRGERLDEFDIGFLNQVLETAQTIKPLVDRQPAYQPLYARALGLYEEITQKGLENEKR